MTMLNTSRKPLSPFSIVIFGATGDLAHRKILPAFYALSQQGLLPAQCHIVGFARRDWTDETFRAEMRQGVEPFSRIPFAAAAWDQFAAQLHYHRSEFDQPDGYPQLSELLDRSGAICNRRYSAPCCRTSTFRRSMCTACTASSILCKLHNTTKLNCLQFLAHSRVSI